MKKNLISVVILALELHSGAATGTSNISIDNQEI